MIDFFFLLIEKTRIEKLVETEELLYSSNYSMIRSLEKVS